MKRSLWMMLNTNFSVYSWGSGSAGQLCLANDLDVSVPSKINLSLSRARDCRSIEKSNIVNIDIENQQQKQQLTINNITSTIINKNNNSSLFCATPSVKITGGGYHTVFIFDQPQQVSEKEKEDLDQYHHANNAYQLYVCGGNDCGQLGTGLSNNINTLTPLDLLPPIANISRSGSNSSSNSDHKVLEAAAGWNHTLILDSNGLVYSFGSNNHSQLGYSTPSTTSTSNSSPIPKTNINTLPDCKSSSTSEIENSISNSIKSLTTNNLASNLTTTTTTIPTTTSTSSTTTVKKPRLILKRKQQNNNNVKNVNQLIPRVIEHLRGIAIKSISCGMRHSTAVSSELDLFVWGCNKFGQLGLDANQDQIDIPTKLKIIQFTQQDSDSTLLEAQATKQTRSSGICSIAKVACGAKHTLVMSSDNQLYSFGSNKFGQLGLGDTQDRFKPTLVNSNNNILIDKEFNIQCGWSNSCLFNKVDGILYLCGRGDYGQLGNGKFQVEPQTSFLPLQSHPFDKSRILDYSIGSEHLLVLTEDLSLYSFGWNEHFQLGLCEDVYPGLDGENQCQPCLVKPITEILQSCSGDSAAPFDDIHHQHHHQKKSTTKAFVKCGSGHSFIIIQN
ncbi:regulator of chromosome condensation domain-containing protein [Heterostelium album PN500]|uniref:Regulator of chromosome condensation domain-containing protein n=1 Tax=Heterostelium pallidum (strain ATCC 26659 / Pp 5 / PN500) TaxID=670386 RepID=D3BJS6_HETP5|nr:regulator of chromosome condensation domain-containing protein [Heterostelium album PN500]EFA78156.1 regulator of chromosome condensation domain-containing protein [Heterostelium album PN500]|eukprot:XP_020430282.1 regulator of chromosome condensation domain-containing protein [Heterostelium album PN500]